MALSIACVIIFGSIIPDDALAQTKSQFSCNTHTHIHIVRLVKCVSCLSYFRCNGDVKKNGNPKKKLFWQTADDVGIEFTLEK